MFYAETCDHGFGWLVGIVLNRYMSKYQYPAFQNYSEGQKG